MYVLSESDAKKIIELTGEENIDDALELVGTYICEAVPKQKLQEYKIELLERRV